MRSDLEREIERWWEQEAEEVAACPTHPVVCRRPHVFEEAVRPDPGGPIVACTVNGRVLAAKLAHHLIEWQTKQQAMLLEAVQRSERSFHEQMGWMTPEHKQGCGVRDDPSKRCICHLGEREQSP